jgi:hypothetical protein
MLMILWGVVSLSRVPIAASYRQWMNIVIIAVFLETIFSFFYAVLGLQWMPPPSKVFCVLCG